MVSLKKIKAIVVFLLVMVFSGQAVFVSAGDTKQEVPTVTPVPANDIVAEKQEALSDDLSATAVETICDDLDSCFSIYGPMGSGYVTSATTTTVYNDHAYWTYGELNTAIASGIWQPALPYAGKYKIFLWYPHYPGSKPETNSAHYMVHPSIGSDQDISPWNQAINYASWQELATIDCYTGTSCYVKLTDEVHEDSDTRKIWFDAVKFVLQVPDSPVLNSITNPDSSGDFSVEWSSELGANYELQQNYNLNGWETIYTGESTTQSFTDQEPGEWCYQVRANNPNGASSYSEPQCTTVIPKTIYVNQNATGENNGASWVDAYLYLQDALDEANANGGGYQIWVAEGVYYPDEDGDGDHISNDQNESFMISYDDIWLYGGFNGTETQRKQQDWKNNLTILSGDIDHDDTNLDGNYIAEDWNDIQNGNAYHVIYLDGTTNESITNNTIVDGFVITAGKADGGLSQHGGGLYCDGTDYGECSPFISNVTFKGNLASNYGGGMVSYAMTGVSNPIIEHVEFIGNKASDGGGLANSSYNNENSEASPKLINVSFISNKSDHYGGGMYNEAAGLGTSSPILINVVFYSNEAVYGGGIYNDAYSQSTTSPRLVNVTIHGNTASSDGGGIYNYNGLGGNSNPFLENVILWGNTAQNSGAQIYNELSTPTIGYSIIQGSGGSSDWDLSLGDDFGGNIDADPLLVEPATGNLSLQSNSPAVDAGTTHTMTFIYDYSDLDRDGSTSEIIPLDINNDPRFIDAPKTDTGSGNPPVDIGAFEYGASADSFEPDNSCVQAQAIALDTQRVQNIYPSSDEDWLQFTLLQAQGIEISLQGYNRFILELYSSDCETQMDFVFENLEIQSCDYHGHQLSADFDRCDLYAVTELQPGTYYTHIQAEGENAVIYPYTVEIKTLQDGAKDVYEPDNTYLEAKPIELGIQQIRSIYPTHDIDYVQLTLSEPALVNVLVTGELGTEENEFHVQIMASSLDTWYTLHDRHIECNAGWCSQDGWASLPADTYYIYFEPMWGYPIINQYTIQFTEAVMPIISEVAWSGTKHSPSDQWIELYNPTQTDINLDNWYLENNFGESVTLSGSIPAYGHYLLEKGTDDTISDITADLIYNNFLLEENDSLLWLKNISDFVVDTANISLGNWPAGNAEDTSFSSSFEFSSMERIGTFTGDPDSNWATNDASTRNGLDAGGHPINGTPGQPNSITFPENDALCESVPSIALNQDHYAILRVANDIDVYQFDVTELYSTIVATLTPPATGDFDLALFGACDSEVYDPWDIGRRAWHIGRRAWHIGEEQEAVDVRFSVGNDTGTYYLVVQRPDDGTYSGSPYQLSVDVQEPDFSIMNTLILYNQARFKQAYGLDAASEVMDSLARLAGHPKVNGIILDISQFEEVNAAYAAWDAAEVLHGNSQSYIENVATANTVTTMIRNATRTFLTDRKIYIADYAVIVGNDHQIPFQRRDIGPDPIVGDLNWKTESEYFADLGDIANTSLDAALQLDRTLTDDFYGNYSDESTWGADLPRFSIGRLQAEPEEITQQITQFLDTNGVINLSTAAIAGYDFLQEPAAELCTSLSAYDWADLNCTLLDPPTPFSGDDLHEAFVLNAPDFVAHYGHSNHTQLFASLDPPLLSAVLGATPYDLSNNLWLSIGCHSGLALPESENGPYSIVQALSEQGSTYIANTGWAWAMDDPPAYSELLFDMIEEQLTRAENISIGKALNTAKWLYFQKAINNAYGLANNYALLPYHEKVVTEATLYGLPMLEFNLPAEISTLSQQSMFPIVEASIEEVTSSSLPASFHPVDISPKNLTHAEETSGDNVYYSGNNGTSVQDGKPILPQAEQFNFSTSLGRAKGVLWLGGIYQINVDIFPLIGVPTITDPMISSAPVPPFSGVYPPLPVALLGIEEFDGSFTNSLTFQTGQYQGNQDIGTIRLFSEMNFQVGLWEGKSADNLPPAIGAMDILDENTSLHLEVPISDDSGIYRAVVTYNRTIDQSSGAWESIDMLSASETCAPGEHTFQADLPITEDMQYFIQVMDCTGNVSRLLNGQGYFGQVPVNDDFDHALDINSIAPTHNYFTYGATQHADDPDVSACDLGTGQATVWYKYTHEGSTSAIALDTQGTDYDTFIAVWTGSRTNLSPVACNDDTGGTKQSAVAFQVQDGMTYYIEVGEKTTVESTSYKDSTK